MFVPLDNISLTTPPPCSIPVGNILSVLVLRLRHLCLFRLSLSISRGVCVLVRHSRGSCSSVKNHTVCLHWGHGSFAGFASNLCSHISKRWSPCYARCDLVGLESGYFHTQWHWSKDEWFKCVEMYRWEMIRISGNNLKLFEFSNWKKYGFSFLVWHKLDVTFFFSILNALSCVNRLLHRVCNWMDA